MINRLIAFALRFRAAIIVSVLVLVAGGVKGLKGGVHARYPKRTPMTNLLLTMLDKAGVPHVDKLGDSTGRLDLPSLTA